MKTFALIAVDPGPTESAYVQVDLEQRVIISHGKLPNSAYEHLGVWGATPGYALAVEMIGSYGMPVGAEVFDTCIWIGRFIERWGDTNPVALIKRHEVKTALCHRTAGVNDAVIRRRLLDLWGSPGKKRSPGPTYGIKADVWAALAVATTWMMRNGMVTG